jgi:lactoylglutathione lyase
VITPLQESRGIGASPATVRRVVGLSTAIRHPNIASNDFTEDAMAEAKKARAVGFNHVALEVGDIEEALAFYGRLFEFKLRGKSADMAFIDLGDQFLALQKGRRQAPDDGRHFGLVVDDKEAVRSALKEAGVRPLPGRFLDFLDPWGNRIEIVGYDNIQFTKAENVLRGMGLSHLTKNASALKELAEKNMGPAKVS